MKQIKSNNENGGPHDVHITFEDFFFFFFFFWGLKGRYILTTKQLTDWPQKP